MLHDFLAEIRKLRRKEERIKAVLAATPRQQVVLRYITTPGKVTRVAFYEAIKDGNIADKSFSIDMFEIMKAILNDTNTKQEIISAIFWSLDGIEQYAGPKEARQAAKVYFREVNIGLTTEEVAKLLKDI